MHGYYRGTFISSSLVIVSVPVLHKSIMQCFTLKVDNWSSLLKQLYLKQSSPTFPNKEHFIFPSLLLLKDGWELLEGREMHCSSFIFQVHSKRPAVSVRKYILKEWLFKSLKVRLLSSLPSSVYHLSLGWEKMEDKKLCCQSNYLSDQPGTTSI